MRTRVTLNRDLGAFLIMTVFVWSACIAADVGTGGTTFFATDASFFSSTGFVVIVGIIPAIESFRNRKSIDDEDSLQKLATIDGVLQSDEGFLLFAKFMALHFQVEKAHFLRSVQNFKRLPLLVLGNGRRNNHFSAC
jgi:hypothetical protein